ncbi:hypothetical protein QOT17_000551 [Balamuthia mandrillaris]
MIVEIECNPNPCGTNEKEFQFTDEAIACIKHSGLKHTVGPLGTIIEGEPEQVWDLLRRVHEAALKSGAKMVNTSIKILEYADREKNPSMDQLTAKWK